MQAISTEEILHNEESLRILGKLVKEMCMYDQVTYQHQLNVAKLSELIGKQMGLNQTRLETLWLSSLIHDIGKLDIPLNILMKPSVLNDQEYTYMKRHVDFGYFHLGKLHLHKKIIDIATQHHEREDGSGYPQGLTSNEIYLEAKILAVADVFEAMMANRPYRAPTPVKKVIEHLQIEKGKLFDEQVVNTLIALLDSEHRPEILNFNHPMPPHTHFFGKYFDREQ